MTTLKKSDETFLLAMALTISGEVRLVISMLLDVPALLIVAVTMMTTTEVGIHVEVGETEGVSFELRAIALTWL